MLTIEYGFCVGLHSAVDSMRLKCVDGKYVVVCLLRLGYIYGDLTFMETFVISQTAVFRHRRAQDSAAGVPIDQPADSAKKNSSTSDIDIKDLKKLADIQECRKIMSEPRYRA